MNRWPKLQVRAAATPFAADAVFCSAAAIFETFLLLCLPQTPLPVLLVLHSALCIVMCGVLIGRTRSGSDTGLLSIALVATTCTGLIGGLGCALLAWLRVVVGAHGFKPVMWRYSSDVVSPDLTAARQAALIQSGRAISPRTPVPTSLQCALTDGLPVHRKHAFFLLRTKYEPRFADALKLALASDIHPIRAPANAIFASLLETALSEARKLAAQPADSLSGADGIVAEARCLLLRTPLGVVAQNPICDLIAAELYTLCRGIIYAHPRHRSAILVGGKALMVLDRYSEAECLLRQCENPDGEVIALLLECLLKRGSYDEFGRLREATMSSEP